jgi:hypothetical protein
MIVDTYVYNVRQVLALGKSDAGLIIIIIRESVVSVGT